MNKRTFVTILSRKAQYNFPKMRGGGQRQFGTFPKIHPICLLLVYRMHKKVWTRNRDWLSGVFATETLKCVEVHWPKSSACENAAVWQ